MNKLRSVLIAGLLCGVVGSDVHGKFHPDVQKIFKNNVVATPLVSAVTGNLVGEAASSLGIGKKKAIAVGLIATAAGVIAIYHGCGTEFFTKLNGDGTVFHSGVHSVEFQSSTLPKLIKEGLGALAGNLVLEKLVPITSDEEREIERLIKEVAAEEKRKQMQENKRQVEAAELSREIEYGKEIIKGKEERLRALQRR